MSGYLKKVFGEKTPFKTERKLIPTKKVITPSQRRKHRQIQKDSRKRNRT